MLSRLGEKVLGFIALGLLVGIGIAIWQMGPGGRAAVWAGIWKTIAWLALAAALPWIVRVFVTRLLAIGSNWAGIGVLAALVVVDLAAGLALLGGWPAGGWGWLASLAALAVAATYNFLVVEYLAEQYGG